MREDTICAIATAIGEGGIGIIRISGDEACNILNKLFKPAKKLEKRILTYGHIIDPKNGATVDEVMACIMPGPHSYTCEDVCEIQCHGGMISLKKILNLVLENGARMAEEGEFTKRAFLNGRLDLTQAEAVIDLIRAKTDKTFDVALGQLEGIFGDKIRELRKELVDCLVNLTVNIDYPDEDIEEITYENLKNDIEKVKEEVERLLETSNTGKIIKDGLKVSIVGKPNVGKSSLMNAIIGENRAIVTDIPGTTRDTIEEMVSIKNIPVVLTDTAGIHETEDLIEKIGIEKSKEAFNNADLIVFVVDSSNVLEEEDLEIIEHIGKREVVVLLNKADCGEKLTEEDILAKLPNAKVIKTVLVSGEGLIELGDAIENFVYGKRVSHDNRLLVTNTRQENILKEAKSTLGDSLNLIETKEPLEFIDIDVNHAYELLGEIVGETAADDIIDKVFERFCLGK